jgi:hypothetical protein
MVRVVFIMVFALSITMLLQLVVVGAFQHNAAQQRMFDDFRADLARRHRRRSGCTPRRTGRWPSARRWRTSRFPRSG